MNIITRTSPHPPAPATTTELADIMNDPSVAPGAGEALKLGEMYADAQHGMRRVVALGWYCFELKNRLPHGQFLPWVEKHCPQISDRSVNAYMELTKHVLEACGCQIRSTLRIFHGGQFLLLADQDISPEARELKGKICAILDGKSQRQLRLAFKDPRPAGGDRTPRNEKGEHLQSPRRPDAQIQQELWERESRAWLGETKRALENALASPLDDAHRWDLADNDTLYDLRELLQAVHSGVKDSISRRKQLLLKR